MKIKQLQNTFREVYNGLIKLTSARLTDGDLRFTDLKEAREAINKLDSTGLLRDQVEELLKSALYMTNNNEMNINYQEGRLLNEKIHALIEIVNALYLSFEQIGGSTNENSISIKLPDVKDFGDLAKYSKDFQLILDQVIINDDINGEVRIDSVENGSIWMDVFLGTTAAVQLIGGVAWSAAVVYKKVQEGKLLEQQVISLEIKNDSLKEIQEKQKVHLDMMIDAEAKSLYNENFSGDNHEQIERLKHSVKMLAGLLEKGAEIHPALNQPENVKNLFPNMKTMNTIESKIKKIEE